MIFNEGDVIDKRGIIFKDDYTPDPKGVHPAMIALGVSEDNQFMYFLTLTSQTNKYFERSEYKEKYYLIKKTPYNMLQKTSLVNLQNIYKEKVIYESPVAFVQQDEYEKLIQKFEKYQAKNPDEYYSEIKELLHPHVQ